MMNFNLSEIKNIKNIKYIIICIFVVFALIHLYKINNNSNEPFLLLAEDQIIKDDRVGVYIPSMDQVTFGADLTSQRGGKTLNKIISDTKTELIEKIASAKTDLTNTVDDTKTSLINTEIAAVSSKVDNTKKSLINTEIAELAVQMNYAMPELSVIAYASSSAPPGWQVCDGTELLYYNNVNNSSSVKVPTSDTNPILRNLGYTNNTTDNINYYITPDLKGRFILGKNPAEINTGTINVRSVRTVKQSGGVEKHQLLVSEMPKHSHKLFNEGPDDNGRGQTNGSIQWHKFKYWWDPTIDKKPEQFDSSETGSSLPHENMPPFYVLTYIIKKPIKV
jgi:microcystin-dependent protein